MRLKTVQNLYDQFNSIMDKCIWECTVFRGQALDLRAGVTYQAEYQTEVVLILDSLPSCVKTSMDVISWQEFFCH